jgi:predicted O-linked N-acetylglucosamine transferase (SPINDLY family)
MKHRHSSREQEMAFARAFSLHQAGEATQAREIYLELLKSQPLNADLLRLLGTAEYQLRNLDEAVTMLKRSLALSSDQPVTHNNLGNVFQDMKRFDEALGCYDDALRLAPEYAEAFSNRGSALKQLNRLDEALADFDKALAIDPGNATAHNNRGNVLLDMKRLDEALDSYDKALAIAPHYADAHVNRGNVLRETKRLDEALACFDRALTIAPNSAVACNNRGNVLQDMKRLEDALLSYDRALAIKPDYAEAYSNVGNVLREMGRPEDALACYDIALKLAPGSAVTYNNRGNALQDMRRFDDALASYDQALAIAPAYAEACNNRGNVLQDMRCLDAALASYDQALALNPQSASAYKNRGNVLLELRRLEESLVSHEMALALKPDSDFMLGETIHTRMKLCQWKGHEEDVSKLRGLVASHQKVSSPLILQTLIDSPEDQKTCAETYANAITGHIGQLESGLKYTRHEKVRIGYFSSDFGDHPVTHLLAGLFEAHDRSRFEIYCFSLMRRGGQWRDRVEKACEHFIEVESRSDIEIVTLARSLEIDLAVDLNGFTTYARTGVFARRVAPVQVSYIGFLGTMGAPYIDYLIADKYLVPEEQARYYAEKIAYLPVYQCNDDKQIISDRVFTRQEAGLPDDAFVFCSFNNNFKITPAVFATWMRILRRVPGSVLWLYANNETARKNLVEEAEKLGLEGDRLIFITHLPLEEHLSRQRLADLFLDTYPYNAGTTASNALRVGLPIITCSGSALASRVAGSVLNALGLPELVVEDFEHYEMLAVRLAEDKNLLGQTRDKLLASLQNTSLFNTEEFARSIESTFAEMYELCQQGLPPSQISIEGK